MVSSSTTAAPPAGFKLPQVWDGSRFSESQRFSNLQAFGRYAQLSNSLTLQRSTGDSETFNQYRSYDVPHSPNGITATLHKPPAFRRFVPHDTPQAAPGEREGHGWLPRSVRPPLNPPIEYPIQRRRNDPLGITTYSGDLRANTTYTTAATYTAHGLPERRPRNMEKFIAPLGMCVGPSHKTVRELRTIDSGHTSLDDTSSTMTMSMNGSVQSRDLFGHTREKVEIPQARASTAPTPQFRKTVTFTP